MKQHLLAIIAALAAIILALFSIDTGPMRTNTHSACYRVHQPTMENPLVETFPETSLQDLAYQPEDETPEKYDGSLSPVETRNLASLQNFATLHHTAMTALSPAEIPPLDAGMVNVTGNSEFRIQNSESDNGIRTAGYRMQFPVTNSGFQVTIPYDPALLPQGFTEDDIQTYVYDRQYRRWVAIERDSVNEVELLVYSRFSRNPVVGGRLKSVFGSASFFVLL